MVKRPDSFKSFKTKVEKGRLIYWFVDNRNDGIWIRDRPITAVECNNDVIVIFKSGDEDDYKAVSVSSLYDDMTYKQFCEIMGEKSHKHIEYAPYIG